MKKKKILLGVLLASASFALFACTNSNDTNKDNDNSSETGNNDGDQNQGGGDVVVTQYTVTFNTNGGSTVPSQTIDEGGKVTRPADPTKTATATETYTFAGWYKDSAFATEFNFTNDTITAATTLYAKWNVTPVVVTKYTVTFNTNGGSAVNPQEVVSGGKVTRPADPTKAATATETYSFAGWYKDSAFATEFNFTTDTITAATTLYAKWNTTPISQDVSYIDLSINTANVTKEFQIGQILNVTGLVVNAITDEGEPVVLTSSDYTVSAKDSNNTAIDITAAFTASGTYTVIITAGDLSRNYTIEVKAEQFKFSIPFSADSYNASLETPYEGNAAITAGSYTFFDNRAFKIEFECTNTNGKLQTTDSNGNSVAKTYNGVTYNSRFQVNDSAKAFFKLTPKVSGEIALYFNTSATRYIAVHDTAGGDYNSAVVSADNASNIIEHKFTVEANHTYEVKSNQSGANIYALQFNASVNASERIETDKLVLTPAGTDFNISDNKFDTSNVDVAVKASDNFDNLRDVALTDCQISVKDADNNPVTGEINTAGEYTVTITYNGVSASYNINVVDLNAPITAITVDYSKATTAFYEYKNGTFTFDGIKVAGVQGGVDIEVDNEIIDVQLLKDNAVVSEFSTTGEYTVKVVLKDDNTVFDTYTVNYYAVEQTEITLANGDAVSIKTGSTKFIHNARLTGTYSDGETADKNSKINLDNLIDCAFYSDEACTDAFSSVAAAFAEARTVYAKLTTTVGTTEAKVITITVGNLTTFTWKAEYINPVGKADNSSFAACDLDNNFTLVGDTATVRVNSAGTKVNSVELGRNLASYIQVTLDGPATIVVSAASTGGSNTTTGFGVYNTDKTLADGVTAQSASTTTATDLTFEIGAAGTYLIGYTETARNGRIISIVVTYK